MRETTTVIGYFLGWHLVQAFLPFVYAFLFGNSEIMIKNNITTVT